MRLETRYNEKQDPTRIIIWSENSESDLSSVVVGVCVLAMFICSIVCTVELHGIPHIVALVFAVLSGIYVALMTIPILIFVWVIVAIEGAVAERPSIVQRGSWVAGAVLVGAVLGSDAYAEGFPSLMIGPALMLAAVAALPALKSVPSRIRRAIVKLVTITSITAVAVGLTIFL
jgi:hypothetical protein